MTSSSANFNTANRQDIVLLNVGGNYFTTSKGTLTNGTHMLSSMFSGRMPIEEGNNGSVFIDRDGKHFRSILNFLRDGSIPLPEDERELHELKTEARYYCIDQLEDACEASQKNEPTMPDNGVVAVYGEIMHERRYFNIPLNQNGTLTLSMVQSAWPYAKGVAISPEWTVLQLKDGVIFPPSNGWKWNSPGKLHAIPLTNFVR